MKINHDLADWLHLGLGGHLGFLTGDFEDGVIFDIIDNVGGCSGRYPESLIKFCHDFADWIHLELGGHRGFLTGDLVF